MDLSDLQINMMQFYKLGMFCFLIIAVAQSYTLINGWGFSDLGMKVSGIVGVIFDLGLFAFFNYFYQQQKEFQPKEEFTPDKKELEDLMESLK